LDGGTFFRIPSGWVGEKRTERDIVSFERVEDKRGGGEGHKSIPGTLSKTEIYGNKEETGERLIRKIETPHVSLKGERKLVWETK